MGNKGHSQTGKIEENLLKGWFTKMYWVKGEKQNISCCVSKQRVSQSSGVAATHYGELVSPEEIQDMKRILQIKGMISVSPDSRISPYIEKCKIP